MDNPRARISSTRAHQALLNGTYGWLRPTVHTHRDLCLGFCAASLLMMSIAPLPLSACVALSDITQLQWTGTIFWLPKWYHYIMLLSSSVLAPAIVSRETHSRPITYHCSLHLAGYQKPYQNTNPFFIREQRKIITSCYVHSSKHLCDLLYNLNKYLFCWYFYFYNII